MQTYKALFAKHTTTKQSDDSKNGHRKMFVGWARQQDIVIFNRMLLEQISI